jgi:TRAP-type C4-dicarboxylate transport system permease small subunit
LIARRTWLALADKTGRLLEDAVLVSILSGMILLAAGQILLRNVFDVGFIWTDELLRMLVLWIALAGAVAASRADKQINIAVLDRLLSDKLAAISKILVHALLLLCAAWSQPSACNSCAVRMLTAMCCWAMYRHGCCSWCCRWALR